MPIGEIELFQVDERVAPDGDPDRNWTHVESGAAPGAPVPRRDPMPVTEIDLAAAARRV